MNVTELHMHACTSNFTGSHCLYTHIEHRRRPVIFISRDKQLKLIQLISSQQCDKHVKLPTCQDFRHNQHFCVTVDTK